MRNYFLSIFIISFGCTLIGCNKTHNATEKSSEIMNRLIINEIEYKEHINIDIAEKLLEDNTELQTIATLNWSEYSYKPKVDFRIAYYQDQIWLKYYIIEENIMAKETNVNGSVYKDSCVEFFISPDRNDVYYNFEFNCIGTPHVGYGEVGTKRTLLDPEILKLISIKSSLGNKPFEEKTGGHQWEMMIIIPIECLAFNKDLTLKGLKANANFYKCGDDTATPHYITWNPINTEIPNYHQPKYFGEILFEK